MGLFVKIVPGEFSNASRDKRELSVVKELGHEVIVVAKSKNRINDIIYSDGWNVHHRSTRPLGQHRSLAINRLISIFTWAKYVRSLHADFISGHNITGLLIAWISTWFQSLKKRPILIYDAHEFETERNLKQSYFGKLFTIHLERFLMKKSALSIVVNDTIANEVQKLHNLKVRPLVVRNISPYWNIDKSVCEKRRIELIESMSGKEGQKEFLVMYHGGVVEGRGIENLILAVSKIDNVAAIILGNGEPSYIHDLLDLIKEKQMADRVLFYPGVSIELLWQYVGAVDVGVCLLMNTCLNHYYALPNKLIENIQSETPVIGSDFPEIGSVIKRYKIGLTCSPDDVNDIGGAIEEMMNNKDLYEVFKKNLKAAKEELCWENERMILMSAYEKLTSMDH